MQKLAWHEMPGSKMCTLIIKVVKPIWFYNHFEEKSSLGS